MKINCDQLSTLLNELRVKNPLEEKLHNIIRNIEENFEFQSMGIFLKVPKSEIFRLKIGRNISHTYAKSTIFTEGDLFLKELSQNPILNLTDPHAYKLEKDYSNLIVLPLIFHGTMLGFMFMDRAQNHFDQEDVSLLKIFNSIICITVQVGLLEEEIEQHRGLYEVTRVLHYKPFIEKSEVIYSLMNRYQRDISIGVLKIDNFNDIVRTIGEHEANDLLKQISYLIKENLRETDIIGKLRQDTYAILMPETTEKNSQKSIERIDGKIMDLPIMKVCSISWGIAGDDDDVKDVNALLKRAEEAVFESHRREDTNIMIYQ